MSYLRKGWRSIAVVPFTAGARSQPVNIQVPSRFVKNLFVYLTGAFTITGGTGAGSINVDGSVAILKLLEFYVDGTPLKVGAGVNFFREAQVWGQTSGINLAVASKAAGANNTLNALVPLHFEAPSTVSPIDTLLDGRLVSTLTFFVTWDQLLTLVPANDGALAAVNLQVELFVEDTDPFAIKSPFWHNLERETIQSPIGTSAGTRIILPFTPGGVMRSMLIQTLDTGAGVVPLAVDTMLKHITLRLNGKDKPIDTVDSTFIRALNNYKFGLAGITPTGYYHVELDELGRVASTGLGAGLGTDKINSVELLLDTVAPVGQGQIVVHTTEHLPPGVSIQNA